MKWLVTFTQRSPHCLRGYAGLKDDNTFRIGGASVLASRLIPQNPQSQLAPRRLPHALRSAPADEVGVSTAARHTTQPGR